MNPIVLILDGATGAGKSTVVELIKDFDPSIRFGAKFTTRTRRATDGDWEFHFVDQIPEHLHRYSYTGVGWEYAVNIDELERTISSGSSYLITCTEPSIARLLSQSHPTVVVYVYRSISASDLIALMEERHTTPEDIQLRQEEVASALKTYAQNIGSYDFVVLNTGSLADLRVQIASILAHCRVAT